MRRSLIALAACATLGAAAFHLHLMSSYPAQDETLATPLTRVALTFSAKVNPRLSSVAILAADSTEVARVPVKVGKEPTVLEGTLPRPLAAGKYMLRWRTAGSDGHAIRGGYDFTVGPAR